MDFARPPIAQHHPFETALRIIADAHAGQVDKRGEPYVLHPLAVMALLDLDGLSPQQARDAQLVALLHDVIEDTRMGVEDIEAYGFSRPVCMALEAVTLRPGEGYFEYIVRCSKNPVARRVKMADLRHNLSVERMTGDAREDERRDKYMRALWVLECSKPVDVTVGA